MTDTPTTFEIIDGSNTVWKLNASESAAGSPATITPSSFSPPVTYVDRSGTIATGGSAQELMPANAVRRGWCIRNLSGDNLFINETGVAATQASPPCWIIPPNTDFPTIAWQAAPNGSISIIGPTTGQKFIAREF